MFQLNVYIYLYVFGLLEEYPQVNNGIPQVDRLIGHRWFAFGFEQTARCSAAVQYSLWNIHSCNRIQKREKIHIESFRIQWANCLCDKWLLMFIICSQGILLAPKTVQPLKSPEQMIWRFLCVEQSCAPHPLARRTPNCFCSHQVTPGSLLLYLLFRQPYAAILYDRTLPMNDW